jgi:AraC-like DNA-binding protein
MFPIECVGGTLRLGFAHRLTAADSRLTQSAGLGENGSTNRLPRKSLMTVFAPTLGALWKQLEGYGLDPDPVFREAGVNPSMMFDPGARIATDLQQNLLSIAAERSGDALFGLKSAEYFRPAHLGALGFAWLASSSLRTAFQRLSRYARVIQEKLRIELREEDGLYWVAIDARIPAVNEKIREDGQLAAALAFCRTIAGKNLNPAQARFQQSEPAETGYYFELFRCPLEFGCERTELAFRLADVDKRLTGSNTELAKLNEHVVVKYLAHCEKQDIVNQVKAAIIDGLANGAVTEKSVAAEMYTTPRNLHRKLQKEDTSFKQLLTEVRQDLAQQYIQDRSKTLTEISYLLGFSEVSSFSRAFKGWTGMPPSAAREDVA